MLVSDTIKSIHVLKSVVRMCHRAFLHHMLMLQEETRIFIKRWTLLKFFYVQYKYPTYPRIFTSNLIKSRSYLLAFSSSCCISCMLIFVILSTLILACFNSLEKKNDEIIKIFELLFFCNQFFNLNIQKLHMII